MEVDFSSASGAVGKHSDHVVRRGVAVDGDAVVGFVCGGGEELLKGDWGHRGVCADDAEGGGHVWVDHPGAFCNAGDGEVGVG